MFPLPKEYGAAFRLPMVHLPGKSPCLVAQLRFRPGIGDDLIASRHLAFLSPLKAVHPGHERIRPTPHFQQAATAFALLTGNPHHVGPPFSAQPAAPAGLEPQRHLGDGVALPRFFLLTPETLKIIQDQWVQQVFQLVHVHA